MAGANHELVNSCKQAPPKKDDGQSPLQLSLKTGQFAIAECLMIQGANANFVEASRINKWRAPVLHDALRAAAFNSREKDTDKRDRFDHAIKVLKRLLKLGADPNARDSYGNSCLGRAILDARIRLSVSKPSRGAFTDFGVIFATLLKAGADVHATHSARPESAFEETRGTILARFIK